MSIESANSAPDWPTPLVQIKELSDLNRALHKHVAALEETNRALRLRIDSLMFGMACLRVDRVDTNAP